MNTGESNLRAAQRLIEELRRHGVTRFVICPGSRSSALALALSLDDRTQCVVHHDERGAGYYAVGYARATGRAATIVTTSGTAAVNLFPTIVEASQDNLPLIALTADRPPELHGRGVNQTIDQQNLFGGYVRYFANLLCPDENDPYDVSDLGRRFSRHVGKHAEMPGPVHINCMYREPLVPTPDRVSRPPSTNPNGIEEAAAPELEPNTMDDFACVVKKATQGLLLVGHLQSEADQVAVMELIARLGWPTLADITSGLSATRQPLIVNHHDLILTSERFALDHRPDTILHVGGRLTSKRLLQFIEKSRPTNYLFNADSGLVYDPLGAVTGQTSYDTAIFCRQLSLRVTGGNQSRAWNNAWRSAAETCGQLVTRLCAEADALTEPSLAFMLSRLLGERSGLFLASSMPIRDMDMFATLERSLPVAANRGASGIDGTIASACGYADGLDRPVTLLIGDQAFLHDLSSLPLLSTVRQPVTVVVVNNHGGRIFESLPVSAHVDALERFFVNPHDLSFEKIAGAFGVEYCNIAEITAFGTAYRMAATSGRVSIIEASIDPSVSGEHRSRIVSGVRVALDMLKI